MDAVTPQCRLVSRLHSCLSFLAARLQCRSVCDSKASVHGLDDFARVLNVNAVGTFNVIRLAAHRYVRCRSAQGPACYVERYCDGGSGMFLTC